MNKLIIVFIVLLTLSGCAIQQAKQAGSVDDIDYSKKEGSCSRSCLDTYSECIKGAGFATGAVNTANIMSGCKSSLKACVSTCPDK